MSELLRVGVRIRDNRKFCGGGGIMMEREEMHDLAWLGVGNGQGSVRRDEETKQGRRDLGRNKNCQTGNDWLRINVTGQDVSGALWTDMKEHGTPV